MGKQIKRIKIYTSFGENNEGEFISSVQEFNKSGQMTSNKEYDNENNLTSIIEITYNEQNKPIIEHTDNKEGGYSEKKIMEYDDKGNLISQKIEYFGGDFSIKKFERNEDENILTVSSYDEDNELEEKYIIKYDDKNRIIEKAEYNEKEKLVERTVICYKENSEKILQKEEYNRKNKLEKKHTYYYDDNKNLVGIKTENRKAKLIDWAKLDYNENNKPVCQKTMSGNMLVFEYDESKNSIKEKQYDPSGKMINEIVKITDDNGNLIQEQSMNSTTRYEYEYY